MKTFVAGVIAAVITFFLGMAFNEALHRPYRPTPRTWEELGFTMCAACGHPDHEGRACRLYDSQSDTVCGCGE